MWGFLTPPVHEGIGQFTPQWQNKLLEISDSREDCAVHDLLPGCQPWPQVCKQVLHQLSRRLKGLHAEDEVAHHTEELVLICI